MARFEHLEQRLPLAVTLAPVVQASIHDEPRDGIGDSFNTSFPNLLREQSFREDRAIAEFDFGGITEAVNLAALDFRLSVNNAANSQLRTFDVLVYGGNGQADLSDFEIAASFVHTVTLSVPQGTHNYRLDVTGQIQALVDGGATFIGVKWDPIGEVGPVQVYDVTLTVNGVAEAQGRRGWEAYPNAIRTDGVETFRLEVDAGGAVNAVTLSTMSMSPLLVAPSSGVISLRDDGQGGDRVAGDFIFTSGEFRYDTTKELPDFFGNDPDSPPGVSIVGLGTVAIEELDGSNSLQFLIQPDVGLLRADIPDVAAQSLSADVVVSPHLINVKTDALAIQHSMRGPRYRVDQVTKPIYSVLPDEFDFFNFFSTNHSELLPRLSSENFRSGIHSDVRVDFTGSRRTPFDGTANYGSAGQLLGLNIIDTLSRGMQGSNVTHELVHQWSAYLDDSLGLSGTYGHFAHNTSAGSIVGGQAWIDNGDGSYTIDFTEGRSGATRAAAIDLYMMGLIEASEVPDILRYDPALTKFPSDPVVLPGELISPVAIDAIVAAHGIRTPGVAGSQKDFRIGFVAESHNRFLTPTEMTFYEIFAAHYARATPADEPDPYTGNGWSSIDRFFGHGTSWSTLIPGQSESANNPPTATAATFSVTDQAANGTSAGTVVATDPDSGQSLLYSIIGGNVGSAFDVDSATGEITVAKSSQLSQQSQFVLSVRVSDNGIPSQYDTVAITINVQETNVPPVVNDQSFSVAENSSSRTLVGTVAATDANSGQTLTYAITGGNASGAFAINSSTGAITVANSAQLDFESSTSFSLTVAVTDDGSPSLSDSATVTVVINDVNEAPVVVDQTFEVAENSPQGTVVNTVAATDPDAGQSLTFAITGGNTGGAFSINATTGQLTVNNAIVLDFETNPTFALTVSVSDNASPALARSATVTVNLTDVVEVFADLKPGDATNTLDSNADSKFEIAIFSTATFDATSRVDVDSLRFGKTGSEDSLSRHRKTGKPTFGFRDVDGDGRLDLVATFELNNTGLQTGDTLARLKGSLLDGTTFDLQFDVTLTSGGGKGGGKGGPKK